MKISCYFSTEETIGIHRVDAPTAIGARFKQFFLERNNGSALEAWRCGGHDFSIAMIPATRASTNPPQATGVLP